MTTPMPACGLAIQPELVRLHHRIREQLPAPPLYLRARLVRTGRVALEVDDLADPRARDREAEMFERLLDRSALRVEDARLGADEHGRLHPSTTDGSRP